MLPLNEGREGGREGGRERGYSGTSDKGPSYIIPKSCMVKAVEAVVIGDGDIGPSVKQQSNHVVSLLGDGVVERCVPL